jgi:hypothetical protein
LRDPAGRKLSAYFLERKAKFFMNKRYVPTNFDGLIVGPSSSANWDVPALAGVRIYNESLPGGNAAEEKIFVDQALRTGHYKLAVFILAPPVTSKHDLNDGLDTTTNPEIFASFHLLFHEAAYALHAAHIRFWKSNAAADGQLEFTYRKNLRVVPLPRGDYHLDPIALEDYRSMVQSLRSQGAVIVYVIPPMYEPMYQFNKTDIQAYLEFIRKFLPPAPVIDFDGPAYTDLRSNPDNFIDCCHLEPQAASTVSALLEKLVPEAISPGH